MSEPTRPDSGQGADPIRDGLRLLVIDDNPGILKVLREVVPQGEGEVVFSRNPVSAINVFLRERPDAVFIDYFMPGMNGLELGQALHTLDPDCPLVMLTAFDDPGLRDRARRVGVAHFLTKPFQLRELERVIGRIRRTFVPLPPVAPAH